MKKLMTMMASTLLFSGVAQADQVILDDLIVDGSICAGQDCVNGESFGFDTIRLKENNLRIRAVDTSSTSSFPTNDWQITFNDSSNGGANKFSIDDIDGGKTPFTLEAGAPSHSLYVDDGGRVGFGTSTPVVDLHAKSGNTPTLRLEQDGSSGFTPQTWDVAGNEANFFIRDATNGSTLPFKIKPGAPSDSLFIAADGDIGMGTGSPSTPLHVKDATNNNSSIQLTLENNGATQLALKDTGDSAADWRLQSFGGSFRATKAGTGNAEMSLDGSGNVIFLGTVSANNGANTLPDYVFEPDYNLMTLNELESFIKENRHLPNVPSKDDVTRNGNVINMTALQYKLLEKVEELTLYTITQENTINRLLDRLTMLETEDVGN